jgi:site-specific DNA recombinase
MLYPKPLSLVGILLWAPAASSPSDGMITKSLDGPSPTFSRKAGRTYRYYLSGVLLHGRAEEAGSVKRVPAIEVEALVLDALRKHIKPSEGVSGQGLIEQHLERVEVHPEQLILTRVAPHAEGGGETPPPETVHIPWHKGTMKRRREILAPSDANSRPARPIRSETRATLVASIARGRSWLNELMSDASASTQAIAQREGCSIRKVNMTISLAFLAPNIVKAAIEGRLPHGIGVTRLIDLPAEWSRQREILGLPPA